MYPKNPGTDINNSQGERAAFFKRRVEAVKAAVPVEKYAAELVELKRHGETLRGACPVHDGENESSFAVYLKRGRAVCFSCGFAGDILDLFAAVEGFADGNKAFPLIALAERYGVELPERPDSWMRKEAERVRVLDGMTDALADSYRRRWFRVLEPAFDGADEDEQREVWRSLWLIARRRAERRLAERGII